MICIASICNKICKKLRNYEQWPYLMKKMFFTQAFLTLKKHEEILFIL